MAFKDILSRTREEVPEPKDTPEGRWRFECLGVKAKSDKDDPEEGLFLVTYQPISPVADVDDDELASFDDQMTDARVFHRIWMRNARDEFNAWRHWEKHGVNTDGRTMADLFESGDLKGTQIEADVAHAYSDDGENTYVNLSGFTPVE